MPTAEGARSYARPLELTISIGVATAVPADASPGTWWPPPTAQGAGRNRVSASRRAS